MVKKIILTAMLIFFSTSSFSFSASLWPVEEFWSRFNFIWYYEWGGMPNNRWDRRTWCKEASSEDTCRSIYFFDGPYSNLLKKISIAFTTYVYGDYTYKLWIDENNVEHYGENISLNEIIDQTWTDLPMQRLTKLQTIFHVISEKELTENQKALIFHMSWMVDEELLSLKQRTMFKLNTTTWFDFWAI